MRVQSAVITRRLPAAANVPGRAVAAVCPMCVLQAARPVLPPLQRNLLADGPRSLCPPTRCRVPLLSRRGAPPPRHTLMRNPLQAQSRAYRRAR